MLCLASNPEDNLLATGHEDATVRLWDLQTGQTIRTLRGHLGQVWRLVFTPRGELSNGCGLVLGLANSMASFTDSSKVFQALSAWAIFTSPLALVI